MLDFRSDNCAPVRPDVLEALARANAGTATSYGDDDWSGELDRAYSELFEAPVTVFPVATGIAANALCLATVTPVYGAVYCHPTSHIQRSECGAGEFMTGGAKLMPIVSGPTKLELAAFDRTLAMAGRGNLHRIQPATLSLTQVTDMGTVYSVDEVAALAARAHADGLAVHMDGARFANALAAAGASPAAMTWRAGVDLMSFGATKNGVMNTEAVVLFDRALAEPFNYRRLRAGHVWSKMRYAAAQLLAYIAEGRWLATAATANAEAARLAAVVAGLPGVTLAAPVEANEVFMRAEDAVLKRLEASVAFFRIEADLARFVMRWDVTAAEIDALITALHAATRPSAAIAAD